MLTLKNLCVMLFILTLCAAPLVSAWAQDAHHLPPDAPATTAASPAATPPSGMIEKKGLSRRGDAAEPMRDVMMANGSTFMSTFGMVGMGRIDHVEGQIAFLRAEIKPADSQLTLWNAFAGAIRDNAQKHNATVATLPTGPVKRLTAVERLAEQERLLATRLDGIHAINVALTPLYASFDDTQKLTFERIIALRLMM